MNDVYVCINLCSFSFTDIDSSFTFSQNPWSTNNQINRGARDHEPKHESDTALGFWQPVPSM